MFGFAKKKKVGAAPVVQLPNTARLTVIPTAFYGGQDPVIHFEQTTSLKEHHVTLPKKLTVATPGPAVRATLSNKKFFVIGAVSLFVLFVAGASWYYLRDTTPHPSPSPVPPPPSVRPVVPPTPPAIVAPAPTTEDTTTSTALPGVPTSTPLGPDEVGQFPPLTIANTPDLDADQLTDAEEETLTTDSGASDTDQDGYYDGLEVQNLYNPKGFAPVKIIDSGLVREYVNPTWQYRIYYPASWQSAEVDAAGNQVIFSAASGDFVEVHAIAKSSSQTFPEWFGARVTDQDFTDLIPGTNRFQVPVFERRDHLVAYIPTPTTVFVVVYHPLTPGPIAYRHIMMMQVQSFRPGKVTAEIPPQPLLPTDGTSPVVSTTAP